jgi:Flp pilus assembly protein TadD
MKGIGVILDRMGRPAEATAAYQRAREVQRR